MADDTIEPVGPQPDPRLPGYQLPSGADQPPTNTQAQYGGYVEPPAGVSNLVTPGQVNPQQTNFYDAVQNLRLTPQEQNLYQHHLRNLYMGGSAQLHPDSISTLLQAVVTGPDGRYYNIPTIWGGQALPVPLAAQMARSYGWDRWPSYSSPQAADARYNQMHQYIDRDGRRWLDQHGSTSGSKRADNQPDLERPGSQTADNR